MDTLTSFLELVRNRSAFRNDLRGIIKHQKNLDDFQQFVAQNDYKLLLIRNPHDYDCGFALIHYAVKFNPEALSIILKNLSTQNIKECLAFPLRISKCTSFHLAVSEDSEASYISAQEMVKSLSQQDLFVLQLTQYDGDNPLHYAARTRKRDFFRLFAEKLTSDQLYAISCMEYKRGYNILGVLLIQNIHEREWKEDKKVALKQALWLKSSLSKEQFQKLALAKPRRKGQATYLLGTGENAQEGLEFSLFAEFLCVC